MIEKLKAYRARLLKRGKVLEAEVVARCIALIRQSKPISD